MYRIYHQNRFLTATASRDFALDAVAQLVELLGVDRGDFEILDASDEQS